MMFSIWEIEEEDGYMYFVENNGFKDNYEIRERSRRVPPVPPRPDTYLSTHTDSVTV